MKKIILSVLSLILCAASVSAQLADNKVIAHRGAWKADKLPQNSLASFVRAIELGCVGSEFDVYMTKDSVLVLNHDSDLQGFLVEKCTLAELQQKKLSNGETICLLEDIFKAHAKQNRTLAVCEIKPSIVGQAHAFAAIDKILAMVKKYNAENMVMYISFDYSYLRRINELCPTAKTAYLGKDIPLETIIADKQFGIDYNRNFYKQEKDLISNAKKHNINVNVWTVNKVEDMQYFLDAEVDYITTDEPGLLLEITKNK